MEWSSEPGSFHCEGVEIVLGPNNVSDAILMIRDISQVEFALALFSALLTDAKQPRQSPITVAVERGRRSNSAHR